MRLPEYRISLSRVGVTKVRKLLEIPTRGRRPIILLADLKCFVDLPPSQKGTHMSRNLEAINELLEEITKKPVYELEGLCEDIVLEILKRHDYASKCEVEMESELMVIGKTPSNRKEQEFVKIIARANAYRNKDISVEKEVGAEIRGILLHPHWDKTMIGSPQKARASLVVQTPKAWIVKIQDIINILEESMSSKSYGYLTEEEEKAAMRKALASPKSTSAVVSEILARAVEKFDLPDEMRVSAKCIAEGTLFTSNSYCERVTTFGKLKAQIKT